MKLRNLSVVGLALFGLLPLSTRLRAETVVGSEDFNGGATNLISGFDSSDNVDGGPGDWFGIGNLANWPQGFDPDGPGAPFSLADDSAIDISGGTLSSDNAFPDDLEGLFGQNSNFENNFFSVSDIRDEAPLTASWSFDISSAIQNGLLEFEVQMGQQSDGSSFDGISLDSNMLFEYSIDGGAFQTAIELDGAVADDTYQFRAMDSGSVPDAVNVLLASGPNTVEKFEADTGLLSENLYLNKTPAEGDGAGLLDTYRTQLNFNGGSELEIRFTAAEMSFEAFAFDNISITSVPEPSSALLVLGAPWLFFRRRR